MLVLVDRVLVADLSLALGIVGGEREPPSRQLDETEVPERDRAPPLIPLAEMRVQTLEQHPRTIQLSGPDEHSGQSESSLDTLARIVDAVRQLVGLLHELERIRLGAVEAKEAKRREGSRAQGVVAELHRELERQASMLLGRSEPFGATELRPEPLVNRPLQGRIGLRLGKRLPAQSDRVFDVRVLYKVAEEDKRLCTLAAFRRGSQKLICVGSGSAQVTGEELHARSRNRPAVPV
jgi:hypothetical protein